MTQGKRKKIAIVGSGISGLALAYMLNPHHEITVYEKNSYIGGHSRTVDIYCKGIKVPVDTGFIVFNNRNYPLLTSLFDHLDVPTVKSNMSFGASISGGWLEYSTQNLRTLFSQKSNIFRPKFLKMILDIIKFNKNAVKYLESNPSITLRDCLKDLNLGSWFQDYFILAMGGSIWSTPANSVLDFPALTFIRFFHNHGLLNVNNQPQWYTVKGGSREYITRLTKTFSDKIHLNCEVKNVRITDTGVTLCSPQNPDDEQFDEVVFACHSDQALNIIENPTDNERTVLKGLTYQSNRVVLHSDDSLMPKRKNAWASWVYLSEKSERSESTAHNTVSLSYWMNSLQPLETDIPVIVTMNPKREPKQELTYNEYIFHHPVFNEVAIRSQLRMDDIQGKRNLWFCGAYQGYGFHEDGLLSSVKVAEKMGIKPSWT